MSDSEVLIQALESIVADIDNMGDPDTGCLSPGERDELRARLEALWVRRDEFALDEMGMALFERARRLVDGALDS